jgi:DNA-binding beta-propeller fold protein YncE
LALGAVAVALVAVSASHAGGAPVAFVSAEHSSQLVAVNLATKRVIARIPVARGPHNVADAVVGRRPYVLVTSPPAGAVTLLDAVSRKVVKVFRGFGSPHDVEVEGRRAYVTDEARGQLVVIGLRSRRVLARINVGPRPHDVAIGDVAVVTHGRASTYLTLVPRNLGRARAVRRISAHGAPHDVAKQPDTANVYLTYWDSGAVGALDWGRARLRWKRRVGSLVHHVAFDYYAGNRLWVTDHATGHAYLLSARNGRVLRSLAGCPGGAHHMALGGTAWIAIACDAADAVAVYNTRTWRRTLVSVGAHPHGVAVAVIP